tara:strand:+ start:274 stop:948 length:675 start_codon:yes stop_codon:yes gene_type:complete
MFDPGKPDGANNTLKIGISKDGTPKLNYIYKLPARCGLAVRVKQNQKIEIENRSGTQVCDFWAFNAENLHEHLSMEHLHTSLGSILPKNGDSLVSNTRKKMFTIIEDTSEGFHDTVIASCDHHRYQELGCKDYHDNCVDNLRMALIAIGKRAPAIPSPLNLWMNIPVDQNGKIQWLAPRAKPFDKIELKAYMNTIVVMSSCPQDLTPINGNDCVIQDLYFKVFN